MRPPLDAVFIEETEYELGAAASVGSHLAWFQDTCDDI